MTPYSHGRTFDCRDSIYNEKFRNVRTEPDFDLLDLYYCFKRTTGRARSAPPPLYFDNITLSPTAGLIP